MKISISSSGKDLDSPIDPRFGRCAYFLIVETNDMSFEAFNNENISLGGGAGIQSAQFVASKGAKAVITGNCGPNAVRTLSAAGVELFVGQAGTVREVLEKHKRGELKPTTDANVVDHYGLGGSEPMIDMPSQGLGGSPGLGRGMGRGMRCGMGLGRGIGRGGMGTGRGITGSEDLSRTGSVVLNEDQEMTALKEQTKELENMIEEIKAKIKNIESAKPLET